MIPEKSTKLDLVIRVIKGELNKNFEKGFGKMDPYATVKIKYPDGTIIDVGRTKTDWNAHMHPVWNHTCTSKPYEAASEAVVSFAVYEDDVVGTDDLCGSLEMRVQELVGDVSRQVPALGHIRQYSLKMDSEVTGSIFVQASLVEHLSAGTDEQALTKVDENRFESPVKRIGVSGGTAPFFKLILKQPKPHQTPGYFIGKDLSHATDEIQFYEQMRRLADQFGGLSIIPVLNFCFEYEGVVSLPIADAKKEDRPKDLLVMRNMFDGAKKLRLLDIKMGQKTADAGWQGKSRIAALRQGVLDGLTNSAAEGFRLEGFDGLPPVLESMDPLLDFGGARREKTAKKAFRFLLQRLAGHEMLAHLFDVHQTPEDPGAKLNSVLSPEELAELVCSEMVLRLVKLALNCRLVPVPQKWIGSSVALGFDAGETPTRSTPEETIRKSVQVSIFDWGRSELLTVEKHATLTEKEQKDRSQFWGYYVGGIDRLAFEATRFYWHRFSNAGQWKEIRLTMYDFDSATSNDYLGTCTITEIKPETKKVIQLLKNKDQKEAKASASKATITYSLAKREYPAGSRLKSSWRLTIHSASDLPKYDKILLKGTVDAFMEVVAVAEDGKMYQQNTSVKTNTLTPSWEETLEFPIVSKADQLTDMLNGINEDLMKGKHSLQTLLIPNDHCRTIRKRWNLIGSNLIGSSNKTGEIADDNEAMLLFEDRLDLAAMTYEATEMKDEKEAGAHVELKHGFTSIEAITPSDKAARSSKSVEHGTSSTAVQALKESRNLMRSLDGAQENSQSEGALHTKTMREIEQEKAAETIEEDLHPKTISVLRPGGVEEFPGEAPAGACCKEGSCRCM